MPWSLSSPSTEKASGLQLQLLSALPGLQVPTDPLTRPSAGALSPKGKSSQMQLPIFLPPKSCSVCHRVGSPVWLCLEYYSAMWLQGC